MGLARSRRKRDVLMLSKAVNLGDGSCVMTLGPISKSARTSIGLDSYRRIEIDFVIALS